MNDAKVRIGGLWENHSKDGKRFLSGSFGPSAKIMIFENQNARGSAPQWTMYLVQSERRDAAKKTEPEPSQVPTVTGSEEDVPF